MKFQTIKAEIHLLMTKVQILADEMSIKFRPVVIEIKRKERRHSASVTTENTRKRRHRCIEICGVKVDADQHSASTAFPTAITYSLYELHGLYHRSTGSELSTSPISRRAQDGTGWVTI
jgi:hypothetical protein